MTEKQNAEMLIKQAIDLLKVAYAGGSYKSKINSAIHRLNDALRAAAPSPHPRREEQDTRDAYEIFDYARQAILKRGGTAKQAEIAGLHAAIIAAYDVFPAPPPAGADAVRALDIVRILANTPPNEWRRRSEIYAELAEFRTLPAPQPQEKRRENETGDEYELRIGREVAQPQEKPECTCGGDPDQPASHHDISCPAALPDDQGEK